MADTLFSELLALECAYYEGVGYRELVARVGRLATSIAASREADPASQACRAFAPLLWGGKAGAAVDPAAVTRALEGPRGAHYLRAWVELARVVATYRAAA